MIDGMFALNTGLPIKNFHTLSANFYTALEAAWNCLQIGRPDEDQERCFKSRLTTCKSFLLVTVISYGGHSDDNLYNICLVMYCLNIEVFTL